MLRRFLRNLICGIVGHKYGKTNGRLSISKCNCCNKNISSKEFVDIVFKKEA